MRPRGPGPRTEELLASLEPCSPRCREAATSATQGPASCHTLALALARFCARCGALGCACATFPAAWPRRSEPLAGCSAPTALAQPPRRAHRAPTPHTRGCAHCATLPAVTALLLGLPSCGDAAVRGALLRGCCVQRRGVALLCISARLFPPFFLVLQRLWTQGGENR